MHKRCRANDKPPKSNLPLARTMAGQHSRNPSRYNAPKPDHRIVHVTPSGSHAASHQDTPGKPSAVTINDTYCNQDTWEGAPTAGTHLRRHGHLRARTPDEGAHLRTRTPLEGHVTCVITGYLYQSCWMDGISPEPNSTSATLYLYLSTSPRLFSHLGFLFMSKL